jgi:hypothetical protein
MKQRVYKTLTSTTVQNSSFNEMNRNTLLTRKHSGTATRKVNDTVFGVVGACIALMLMVNTYNLIFRKVLLNNDDFYVSVPYAIFYNAFVNPKKINHSIGIITEQLEQWQASKYRNATLYYTHLGDASVPFPCPKSGNCKLLAQKPTGWENETLAKLQEYCQEHLDHNVIYLHSKGSFHDRKENIRLRNLITLAALSKECYIGLTTTQCSICSARFAPTPHWHTSGNMWNARCSYITKLYPVLDFEEKITKVVETIFGKNCTQCYDWALGMDRYSIEHWVHTHPHVNPCDVYPNTRYICGYPKEDIVLQPFSLQKAPRSFPDIATHLKHMPYEQTRLKYRLNELRLLYNETPASNSFVWTWYKQINRL